MTDYTELVKALQERARRENEWYEHGGDIINDAADAIEALQAEVKRLQEKLCDWCAVCPKGHRKPEDCELLSETPVMYVPSEAKMEVQDESAGSL